METYMRVMKRSSGELLCDMDYSAIATMAISTDMDIVEFKFYEHFVTIRIDGETKVEDVAYFYKQLSEHKQYLFYSEFN